MDVLSEAITAMRRGRPESFLSTASAPWGLRFAARDGVAFHMVLRGSCWLLPGEGGAPVALGPGDVVLRPHGTEHGIADDPATPLTDIFQQPDGQWAVNGELDGTGATTRILCGAYRLSRNRQHPLLSGLPDLIHLPADIGAHPELRAAVDLLGRELERPGPGSDALLPALLDTLLLYVMRACLNDQAAGASTGWAAALADPAMSAALHAIHDRPADPWTVESLGSEAGLSRAVFAQRFTATVGQPPMAYLTWWRLTRAGQLLTQSDAPLRSVARECGYSSEFTFVRAFTREYGTSPGRYRRAQGTPAA
ncbi:AraC family transcriptional regulator [Promicromonospora sp. NPDC023805]|uniref:AraC family transcriptional regulator n=1 Tax=Promicromonospora sp. NPDC023805 TaxID=3154696 RepID=UPI0033CC372C